MEISASIVKELRERTGAGMMECKKALVEAAGKIDDAVDILRKSGAAKVDKKASRVAAEGITVVLASNDDRFCAIVEVNSETDFVSKGDDFKEFSQQVAESILKHKPDNVEAVGALLIGEIGATIETTRQQLVAKIGENIKIRRFQILENKQGVMGTYLHGSRIAVVVTMKGGNTDLARDVAMHIAASQPVCINADQVPQELLAKEKEIFMAKAAETGKPAAILEKMVQGQIQKYLQEVTLVGQPYVKDPDKTVGKLLSEAGAEVLEFVRYKVGEGVEKKVENFAEEVMAQVRGAEELD